MQKTLSVRGMMCPHCEAHVKEALEKIEGVVRASCDHKASEAVCECVKDVQEEAFRKAVGEAGYEFCGVISSR